MPIVNYRGKSITFPDDMSEADISNAMPSLADQIDADLLKATPPKKGLIDSAIEAVKSGASFVKDAAYDAIDSRTLSEKGLLKDKPENSNAMSRDVDGVPFRADYVDKLKQQDRIAPKSIEALKNSNRAGARVADAIINERAINQELNNSVNDALGANTPEIPFDERMKEQRKIEQLAKIKAFQTTLESANATGNADNALKAAVNAQPTDADRGQIAFEQDRLARGITEPTGNAERFFRDYESGAVGSTGAALSFIGKRTGAEGLSELGDSMENWSKDKAPAQQTFADKLVNGIGSMSSFYVPGIGVAKGAQALSVISPVLAKWAGAGTMAALEASAEADGVYKSLVEQGLTNQEAMDKADVSFMANMALLGVTNKVAFFNDIKMFDDATKQLVLSNVAKKGAVGFVSEGAAQEAPQQMIANYLTDKPLFEGVAESALIGGIVGGGAAVVGGIAQGPINKINNDIAQRAQENIVKSEQSQAALQAIPEAESIDDAILLATEALNAPLETPLSINSEAIDASELLAEIERATNVSDIEQGTAGILDSAIAGNAVDNISGSPIATDNLVDGLRPSDTGTLTAGVVSDGIGNGTDSALSEPLGNAEQLPAGVDVVGDKIDKEWTAFNPDTGTLGIPRAEMPQIKAEHRGAMVNFLNARGIEHEQETLPADSLKPTQLEFSESKVEKAIGYKDNNRSILVSADNHVLDGHHQWLAKLKSGEDIDVIRLKAPIQELLGTVAEFPSAQVAEGATSITSESVNTPETKPVLAPVSPVKKSSKKSGTLLATLRNIGGISNGEKLDVTGEKKGFAPGGYNQIFKLTSKKTLRGVIESGDLDDFLPPAMRLSSINKDSGAFDSAEAYDYLADKIRNGERVINFDAEQEINANKFYQADEATAQTDIDEAAFELLEDEINEQLRTTSNEERETATEAKQFVTDSTDSVAGSGERAPSGNQSGAGRELQPKTVTAPPVQSPPSQEREGVRELVTALVKRRAAANELGKAKQFDEALQAAKDFMAGKDVKPAKFLNAALAFNKDQPTKDAFNALLQLAKAPAKEARKAVANVVDDYKAKITAATTEAELTALGNAIQKDKSLSDTQAIKLDDAIADAQDKLENPDATNNKPTETTEPTSNNADLLGDNTAGKQAIADAERAKDAKRNTGNGDTEGFTLTGSNSEADIARASGAQDLFAESEKDEVTRAKEAQPEPQQSKADEVKPAKPKTPLNEFDNAMDEYNKGIANVDDYKTAFDNLLANEQAIKDYLDANFTKQQLFNRGGYQLESRYKSEKKIRVVGALYSDMVSSFLLPNESGMTSYSTGFGEDRYKGIKSQVAAITQESLDKAMDRQKQAIIKNEEVKAERLKGIDDPKTLDDYTNLLRSKMVGGTSLKDARLSLTPEQRATYDALYADKTIADRASRKEAQKDNIQTAGQTVSGNIIETKHTKKLTDLFVVQLAERVSKEDYTTLNTGAKKLGGYYSSFRGAGAVPGFQFTSRENAEAFVQLAGGDNSAAKEQSKERRDAFEDDKSQSAVERLTEMAERLESKANEDLNRDRKTNTSRRAGMAARAEAAASAEKAMAITMRNIATAIESGKAKYLGKVRQKVQVELLQSITSAAQYEKLRKEYPAYSDYEKHKDEPVNKEAADFAEFPMYGAYRSDLASLGRSMVAVDGLKILGNKLLSVADDVTDAYLKFAKENVNKVSRYTTSNGLPAAFSSKALAEEAIARSGFNGKAIVLPFKRGENLIIDSPSVAVERGVWNGDDDKRITLTGNFGAELVEKIGKANRRTNKVQLPWQFENAYDKRAKLKRMGIENAAELRAALREFIGLKEEAKQPDKIKQLERAMIGRKNDGLDFFPTPASTADEMIDAADIQDGMSVLEPSAGMGHIAERIRDAGFEPDVIEFSGDRRELLEIKGFNVVGSDFLGLAEKYDRIIMNPPFSNRRDEEHVRHAYNLLKPNGKLVAIMGEGVFFGSDKRATEFRDWLESVGGTSEKLEEGTFKDASLPVNTGVNARMVVIEKQTDDGNVVMFSRSASTQQSYETRIDELLKDEKPNFGSRSAIVLDKSDVLDMLGYGDKQVYLNESKVVQGKYNHKLTAAHWKKIPEWLENPAMVFDSDTVAGRLTFIAPETLNGAPIRMIIEPDASMGGLNVNLLVNAYDAEGKSPFSRWVNDGLLRYYDKAKSPAVLARSGLQLPSLAKARSSSGRILVDSDLVKYRASNTSFSQGATTGGLPIDTVKTIVDNIKSNWKNAPPIFVVDSMQDDAIPKHVREYDMQLKENGATGDPIGFISGGKVFILSTMVKDTRAVHEVLFHEALGHYGLRGVYGDSLNNVLDNVALMRRKDVIAKAKEYGFDIKSKDDIRKAAEEVLAEMAQTNPQASIVQRAIAAIRKFLRDIGFDIELSDNDIIANYLLPAREFVINGGKEQRIPSALKVAYSRKENDTVGKENVLKSLYRLAENTYDETDNPDAAYEMLFNKANDAQKNVLRAIKRDDFLGYDYPHQAIAELINNPEAYEISASTKAQLSKAGNDIRFSRQGTLQPKWDSLEDSKMDDLIRALQDKNIDLKRVTQNIKKAVGVIDDRWNAYLQEELYHGRTAKRTQDFIKKDLEPLIEDMRMRGVSMAEFEEYLLMRHAEERNIQIAKINPDMQDGGSGVLTADAQNYLTNLTPALNAKYAALAKRIDAINKKSRQVLIDYGLESTDTIAAWEGAYQYYVPLMREDMDTGFGGGTGQGFSIKGSSTKRAMGSSLNVVDIIANIAQQYEKNIVRGEKNRVSTALIGLAKLNPNSDFWEVDTPPTIKAINKVTGQVEERTDPNYKTRDNVVVARIRNKLGQIEERSVVFNEFDERAMKMAASIKNLDVDNMEMWLEKLSIVTRYFASINTQYNPIFGVINITRDVQGALLNLSTTEIAGKQKEVIANTMPALRAIYSTTRKDSGVKNPLQFGKFTQSQKDKADEMVRLFEEYQNEGGATGFRDMFKNAQDRTKAIEKALDPDWWTKTLAGKVVTVGGVATVPASVLNEKAIKPVFEWLSDYNQTLENAVRLSVYKVGLDNGLSKQQSASIAKNISVNFNRKGSYGRSLGAMYAFFNASAQGTARIAETLKGPRGKQIVAGGVFVGVMQAVALALAGYDDEEPPEFVRDRNIIIPLDMVGSDGKFITVPMPLGFNVLPNFGRITTEWLLSGGEDTSKRATHIFSMMMEMFNPIGGNGSISSIITPTAFDPFNDLDKNKDWTDRDIARKDFNTLDPTPGFTRTRDKAWSISVELSRYINNLSGGDDYTPGVFSPTGDQIEYLAGQVTGGVGREIIKTGTTIESLVTGEDLPTYKIPLVGIFVGNSKGQAPQGGKFYNNLIKLNKIENGIIGRDKDGKDVDSFIADNPEDEFIDYGKKAYKAILDLRKEKRAMVESESSREEIKAIDDEITTIMTEFNDAIATAKKNRASAQ